MYSDAWKYPSEWTESWDSYVAHREELCARIVSMMTDYASWHERIPQQAKSLTDNFFSADQLLENIK